MKFIHTSDIRIGASPDAEFEWGEDRKLEIEEALDIIVSICNESDIDLLLIAGNLFAAPPTEEQLIQVDEKLENLVKTRTIIIPGYLDYASPTSPAASFTFNSRTVMLPGGRTTNAYLKGINTCVTGYGYDRPEIREDILGRIDPGRQDAVNILLGSGGDMNHMPFRPAEIAKKGFDYVALGGKSKSAHILKNRLAYSGCPEPIGPEETGRRGFIIGEVTDEGTKISLVPSNKRSYIDINITLSPELTAEAVVAKLDEMLLKLGNENIYTIIFKGFALPDFSPDLKRIKERYLIRNIEDMTINSRDEEKLCEENGANLIGSFVEEIRECYNIDENIRNKAMRYGLEALIMSGEE